MRKNVRPELIELGQRLTSAIIDAGGKTSVAKRLGKPLGTIDRWMNAQAEPGVTEVGRLAQICKVSLEALVYGVTASRYEPPEHESDSVWIPVLDVRVSAGAGGWNVGAEVRERVPFTREFFRKHGVAPDLVHGIRPEGDSMLPTIRGGALSLVNVGRKDLGAEGIYVFVIDGQARVKRAHRGFDGSLTLMSDNSRLYPAERLEREDLQDLNVVGRIFWTEQEL